MLKFIGHDLKAPLQNIRSSIELFKRKASRDNEKFNRLDQLIISGLNLINDLLNPGESINSKFEISKDGHCNLYFEVNDIYLKHPKRGRIKISTFDGKFGPIILGQQTLIRQIIENILSNAFKYSPEGSSVSIGVTPSKEYLTVDISDNGRGIPEDERDLVLRPNYRLSRDKGISGHGIGLYFCVHEIEKLGGKLTLLQNINESTGTTVRLQFKKAEVSEALQQREITKVLKQYKQDKKPKAGSILIVDDSPDIHLILGLYLEEYNSNLEINSATKLSEAKSLLRSNKYDICFTDLNIKEEKGERVLEESQGAKVFIAMSAEISEQEKDRLQHLGFSQAILKQFNFEFIKDILNNYL